MLITNATDLAGQPLDIRFDHRIRASAASLTPLPDEIVIDAGQGLLLPGLHDHHCHFLAYAASLESVDCSDPGLQTQAALLAHLERALVDHPKGLRAIGYHEGDAPLISGAALDKLSATRPIRLQHRTGRLWIFNQAARKLLEAQTFPEGAERDAQGQLTGRFFHMDDWLRDHFPRKLPDLARASGKLAAYGITGLTDAGPDNNSETVQLFHDAQICGKLRQRVLLMGRADLNFPGDKWLMPGPCKIYLKESDLPDFESLCTAIATQHRRQRAVAFHCVTAAELHFALAALNEAGAHPGDRIEHASLCDDEAIALAKKLSVSVVSQPVFIAERGDRYRASIAARELPWLYRARSFLKAGVPFAGSSDAPFGGADPWACMAAALERKTPSGAVLGEAECLAPIEALRLYLGVPQDPGRAYRQLAIGDLADLVLLKESRLALPKKPTVASTWIDGECVYQRA